MIQSVEIKNLRGIQEGRLDDLTPLVVLVGPNGCGKSTVLDALLIGSGRKLAEAVGWCVRRRLGVRRGARWLAWKADERNSPTIKIKHETGTREVTLRILPSRPDKDTTINIDFKDATGSEIQTGSRTVTISPANDYSSEVPDDLLALQVKLVEAQASDLFTPLHQLYSKTVEQGRREEVKGLIADLVPGVRDIVILTEGDVPVVHLVYDDYSVPIALAGDGVQALARLSLELASRPEGIVLVEEPEVHQHPRAIWQSAKAIWAAIRRGIQVVLTTHSLDLIDALLGEVQTQEELEKMSVYRLLLQDGCLKTSRLQGSEVAFSRTTIEDDLR